MHEVACSFHIKHMVTIYCPSPHHNKSKVQSCFIMLLDLFWNQDYEPFLFMSPIIRSLFYLHFIIINQILHGAMLCKMGGMV